MGTSRDRVTPEPASDDVVTAVRRFNRLYTRIVGALDEGHLHSPFSLAEVRVLYEIAHGSAVTASGIARDLRLDAGYLSRLLRGMDERGLVTRSASLHDGRQSVLTLTEAGTATVSELEQRASIAVREMLSAHLAADRRRLVAAMSTIEGVLSPSDAAPASTPYLLRPHRPGDMGWVIARHGALYAEEYQWEMSFEALVSRLCADFIDHFDPKREYCWIAERDGMNVGCVFVVRHPEREGVAKLRMLLVDPSARGLGIGKRLVDECTAFARRAGYHTLSLWTNDILAGARALYVAAGYRMVNEERHHSFGHDLVGQYWELTL